MRDRESDRSNDFAASSDDNGAERRKIARRKADEEERKKERGKKSGSVSNYSGTTDRVRKKSSQSVLRLSVCPRKKETKN